MRTDDVADTMEWRLYYRVNEFAKLARVSPSTVYRLIARGGLPARKFGRRIVLPAWAIEYRGQAIHHGHRPMPGRRGGAAE